MTSTGAVIEGFSDASLAPSSERSQQAVMLFVMGGLVAWSSHRQAFVTMSTAESELVAICELTTCVRSIEELVAELMLFSKAKANDVIKVVYTDSQAALSAASRPRAAGGRGTYGSEAVWFGSFWSFQVGRPTMWMDAS